MPKGPKIDKNIERLILRIHEANPNLVAKEVQARLFETQEWKMIPTKTFPDNWPGVDAIQKLIKETRDIKIRIGPDIKDLPWSIVSLSRYPITPEALPIVLKVWARSTEMSALLTINQALWVSRIYTLYKAKSQRDLNHDPTSVFNDPKKIDELRAIANTLAINEKVFDNDYLSNDYPSNRESILYYWMCDAELYGILPEGYPRAKDLVIKLRDEMNSKFKPEYKSKSGHESIVSRLTKEIDEGGTK